MCGAIEYDEDGKLKKTAHIAKRLETIDLISHNDIQNKIPSHPKSSSKGQEVNNEHIIFVCFFHTVPKSSFVVCA
jgi:hypothetical protein